MFNRFFNTTFKNTFQIATRQFSSLLTFQRPTLTFNSPVLMITREMNRNARRPQKANHGKRPVSHARRRLKKDNPKSRAHRVKMFGFW